MSSFKFIVLILLYYLIIYLFGKKIFRKVGFYLTNFSLAIVGVILSIILIYFSDITFHQAGFQIGHIKKGTTMVIISLIILLSSLISMRKMKYSDLLKVPYGSYKNNKILLVYVWTLVGPSEEFFYRGFIQGNLRMLINGSILTIEYATLIATLIFVIAHVNNFLVGKENKEQFLSLLPGRIIMGLILGYTFQVSESLLYPVLIHSLSDGITISYLIFLKKRYLNDYHL
ncbi:CPBP family intramembrane glutamic endopeptidase [Petrotoga sp. 9PW.55.5.1]|uniref:CPBP family intramembrane glutamic endopeptidase n=1 Tax=Petrotoga sp. 9PW.55.5.1 TaxID=1308979 RepID=UPI000DD71D7C|nr:CPBP family intramembrane glutamic endopeptidase [Petrotoga sp. 9PW.55.5.1]